MSKEKLREAYGTRNSKSKELYNRAIREEIHGGDELLDLLELCSQIRHRSTGETASILRTVEDRIQCCRDAMVAGIKRDYDIGDE